MARTNKEVAQLLRSAASALEHGRNSTAMKKLAIVNENLTPVIEAAKNLCEMNIESAFDLLEDHGYLYEANALALLSDSITPCKDFSDSFSRCDNCGVVWDNELIREDIPDLSMRIGPGSLTPSGECPAEDCRALCFPATR